MTSAVGRVNEQGWFSKKDKEQENACAPRIASWSVMALGQWGRNRCIAKAYFYIYLSKTSEGDGFHISSLYPEILVDTHEITHKNVFCTFKLLFRL